MGWFSTSAPVSRSLPSLKKGSPSLWLAGDLFALPARLGVALGSSGVCGISFATSLGRTVTSSKERADPCDLCFPLCCAPLCAVLIAAGLRPEHNLSADSRTGKSVSDNLLCRRDPTGLVFQGTILDACQGATADAYDEVVFRHRSSLSSEEPATGSGAAVGA
jgi:hypothetical protein